MISQISAMQNQLPAVYPEGTADMISLRFSIKYIIYLYKKLCSIILLI